MQKYLLISLCVLATFVLIDAKPWCGIYGCDSQEYDGNDGHGGGGFDENEFGDDGFHVYRSYKSYPNYPSYDNRIGQRGQSQVDSGVWFGSGPTMHNERPSAFGGEPTTYYDDGQYEFDAGQRGQSRADAGVRYDDAPTTYVNRQSGFGGRRPPTPKGSYGAKIYTYGTGVGNTNTFNLAKKST